MIASPITKGGVITGRIATSFSSGFAGKDVRWASNAKASPSAVVVIPTIVARRTEFQNTPQERSPRKQPRLQIVWLDRRVASGSIA